jgi:hypothetical protein
MHKGQFNGQSHAECYLQSAVMSKYEPIVSFDDKVVKRDKCIQIFKPFLRQAV